MAVGDTSNARYEALMARSPGRATKPPGARGRPLNEAQAERILDEAERIFADHGFAGMRMQALADALEVNKALLFHYYRSKRGLYDAVIGRVQAEVDELIARVLGSERAPDRMLHALVDAYWSFLERRPTFARLMQWGYLGADDEVEALTDGNRRRFESLAGLLERSFDGNDARQAYVTLLGGMLFYWINPRTVSDVLGVAHDSSAALERRRAHLHGLVDALLTQSKTEHPR